MTITEDLTERYLTETREVRSSRSNAVLAKPNPLLVGWSLYHGAAFSIVPGLLGIGSICYWRRLEDRHLESRYGETYRRYRAQSWF